METADHDKATPLRKLDSTVVLERFDSSASSCAYLRRDTRDIDGEKTTDTEHQSLPPPLAPVGLDVSIRFGRLGLLMALAVTALTALTIVFNRGVVLGYFDPTMLKDDAAQKRLIDDYNSYTGNVASAFGRPIEIFVGLAVHLVLLRVMAASLMGTEISWKTDASTLVVTAGVGFLVTNGLNALNVQPQAPEIRPVISAVDLTFVPDFSRSGLAARSTSLTQTFSERSPRNPITNTVLRNLVLPRVPPMKPLCGLQTHTYYALTDVGLEYGFSQRDWQSRLLKEAVDPKQLRVVVNPSNTTGNHPMSADDLPMNVSLAADLYAHSMLIAPYYLRWANLSYLVDLENPPVSSDSVARYLGLLPPVTMRNETKEREWFLRESVKMLSQTVNSSEHISQSDVTMEFSHVDISPTMHFDALTIGIEIDPQRIADVKSKDGSKRYSNIGTHDRCGPWRMWCLMPNPEGRAAYDPPAQVRVFGVCVSPNGAEELSIRTRSSDEIADLVALNCADTSNTSLMVMSIGKRFMAESIMQNKTASPDGYVDRQGVNETLAVVTNMRRIYTFTVAKLSWHLSNLTAEFNAQCGDDAGSCKGLRFPLAPTTENPPQQQELIVGADALPIDQVTPMTFVPSIKLGTHFLPLVQLHEAPSLATTGVGASEILATDPLLPHNIASIMWEMQQPPPDPDFCSLFVQDHIQLVVNNHLYIEHGLQTAYTAATFFLLQNGVVKDVIELQNNKQSLNFQHNTQRVALLASIPTQNTWLTLAGCALLVSSLCSVLVWAWMSSKSTIGSRCGGLGHVTTPHVVARVMLDSVHFPPLFLHRRVIDPSAADGLGEGTSAPTVEGFVIDGLALQPPHGTKEETLAASPA